MPLEPILSVRGLSKRFDGLLALEGVEFDVARGEIFGILGPNGAGKTTLFACLVGALTPSAGTVRFRGERIDGLPNHAVVARGLVRTHQIVRPFREMTVTQNVAIGAHFGSRGRGGGTPKQRVADLPEPTALSHPAAPPPHPPPIPPLH